MGHARATLAERRSDAAPLALLLAAWALALAPVAHPLIAHGAPAVHDRADDGWVHHGQERRAPDRRRPAAHHHAPGAPEHLRLPLLAAATVALFRTVVLASPAPPAHVARPVPLPRRWSQERPQAP